MDSGKKAALTTSLTECIRKWHIKQIDDGNTPDTATDSSLECNMAVAAMAVFEGVADNQAFLVSEGSLEL